MKIWLARTFAVVVASTLAFGAMSSIAQASPQSDDVYALTNTQRQSAGVQPLTHNSRLDVVAQEWANQMGSTGIFAHSTDEWRAARLPAGWTTNGENIAYGYSSASQVMAAWMTSPGHQANILRSTFTDIGIGYSASGNYWVQIFAGYPSAIAPSTDQSQLQNFVARAYSDVLGRAATQNDIDYWVAAIAQNRVTRTDFTTALSRSDEWISSVITRYYSDTLNRTPDQQGLTHWTNMARSGVPVSEIAAAFYASPEYFMNTAGSDNRRWVTDLYQKLLLRSPDQQGLDGWVRSIEQGMPRLQVAYLFYQSQETLTLRVNQLYVKFLARSADPAGVSTWVPWVRERGDLVLAAMLVTSAEYYARR